MELKNKRIVITGAGSGIGKETMLQVLKYEGVKVLACDLNEKNILTHPNVIPYKCDVSKKENLDKLLKDADKKLGGIDIFYANAGFAYYEVIPNADWDRIERIYSTNVFSPFYCLIALNQTRKEPFLFVVTASAMSHLSLPGYALYSSTKAAVRSFIDAFRFELKPGNRVMVVYPIATRTQFFDAAGKKVPVPFPSQSPETVAKKVVKGIESNAKEVYPSFLFRFIQILDRFLFFILPIYQKIEASKLVSLKK
ncbi:SDR family NAD(P)-dependent oxidoreductase [Leptospira bourretii]|uniref:SDR family NAD(P)-dependent oxidoreductase n=1 Tax=Leptospira bourretii TaxID=2484962 RepID=A0A4R9IJJ8_9LEPT|nr:SDR family NAD(P)-dependent oxidoreductase [Leptospira bourretii]TGK79403.1 SDR family NAD(P)-dependent oxidoreductase [Leptospira bourretii]TGK89610.1 SDR family NAD(P)-dependent oxidoreductase [Leptospira bourretii]TGL19627.1 SDR family NAD(P)-dependent oxidoreductase [Leptospira bourretii]TGL30575.1 SDR family NAD(P)-dependent oxidoreductase [Leptospira bourretii]